VTWLVLSDEMTNQCVGVRFNLPGISHLGAVDQIIFTRVPLLSVPFDPCHGYDASAVLAPRTLKII